MKLEDMLKNEFDNVQEAYFENEDGFRFLRIITNFSDLDHITELTHKINDFIDQHDKSDETYFLDVSSKGTENEIEFSDVQVDDHIRITFNKPFKEHDFIEGYVLEKNDDSLLLKWNNKGQIKKTLFEIESIMRINQSAKIKKAKKGDK